MQAGARRSAPVGKGRNNCLGKQQTREERAKRTGEEIDRGSEQSQNEAAERQGEMKMNEEAFQNKLSELMQEIATLPKAEREKLEALAAETQDRHQKLKKTVGDLQESLDYLRVSIKYLVFDLEATRRENKYLREIMNQADQQDDNDDDNTLFNE